MIMTLSGPKVGIADRVRYAPVSGDSMYTRYTRLMDLYIELARMQPAHTYPDIVDMCALIIEHAFTDDRITYGQAMCLLDHVRDSLSTIPALSLVN